MSTSKETVLKHTSGDEGVCGVERSAGGCREGGWLALH